MEGMLYTKHYSKHFFSFNLTTLQSRYVYYWHLHMKKLRLRLSNWLRVTQLVCGYSGIWISTCLTLKVKITRLTNAQMSVLSRFSRSWDLIPICTEITRVWNTLIVTVKLPLCSLIQLCLKTTQKPNTCSIKQFFR